MEMPTQLLNDKLRFVLIQPKDKKPFELNWQKTANYNYSNHTLISWLQREKGNYGVATGFGNLLVIDFDDRTFEAKITPLLPPTFTVKTGSGGTHLYYICDDPKSFKILDKEKNTLADIQGAGKQVVGPGSIHPNGNQYSVLHDLPIASISKKQIDTIFADYVKEKPNNKGKQDDIVGLIRSKVGLYTLLCEYGYNVGSTPTMCHLGHPSKGGKCFSFSEHAGLWYCFHCDEGGDIFSLVMAHEKCDFNAAKKKLALMANIVLPEYKPIEQVPLIEISKIDSSSVNKRISIKGSLRSKTQIMPYTKVPCFQCIGCQKATVDKPKKCVECKGTLFEDNSEKGDLIRTIFQEEKETIEKDTKIATIEVCFKDELVQNYPDIYFGQSYLISGKVKTILRQKNQEFYLVADAIKKEDNSIESINLTGEDKERLRVFVSNPEYTKQLKQAIFGTDLVDLDYIMDVVLLQMVSSPKIYRQGALVNRGNIMVLLAGSPGGGKTQIMRRLSNFFPRSMFATCTSASSIGLTASVQKDERIGEWVVHPGAIPLAHPSGFSAIDELDKIEKDDLSKLNSMMDSLKITIHKANVHQDIPADVSLFCGMNPKYKAWSLDERKIDQLLLPKDFMDRFDLLIDVNYFQKKNHQEAVVSSILDSYLVKAEDEQELNKKELLKFFVYARKLTPKLSEISNQYISKHFSDLLSGQSEKTSYSARLLSNFIRLCMAQTRLRLSEEIDIGDVLAAKDILLTSFKSMDLVVMASGQLKINTEEINDITKKSDSEVKKAIMKLLESKREPLDMEELLSLLEYVNREQFDRTISWLDEKGFISTKSNAGKVRLL